MPTYRNFNWEDFRVESKPLGIRKHLGFLPYLTGSKPEFRLSIKTLSGKKRKIDFEYTAIIPSSFKYDTVNATQRSVPTSSYEKIHTIEGIHMAGVYLVNYSMRWSDTPDLKPKACRGFIIRFETKSKWDVILWLLAALAFPFIVALVVLWLA